MQSKLNIGYFYPSTKALGPGNRFVLWLRGCHRRCPGCASPELRADSPANWMDIESIYNVIASTRDIDGVTISGGEPLLQCEALSALLKTLRESLPNLSIILYTGYTKDNLPADAKAHVIPYVDLLIDGEYEDSLNDGKGLRGSSNQQLYFITDKLSAYRDELENGQRIREIHLLSEYEVLTIGIPPVTSIN